MGPPHFLHAPHDSVPLCKRARTGLKGNTKPNATGTGAKGQEEEEEEGFGASGGGSGTRVGQQKRAVSRSWVEGAGRGVRPPLRAHGAPEGLRDVRLRGRGGRRPRPHARPHRYPPAPPRPHPGCLRTGQSVRSGRSVPELVAAMGCQHEHEMQSHRMGVHGVGMQFSTIMDPLQKRTLCACAVL